MYILYNVKFVIQKLQTVSVKNTEIQRFSI